MEIIRCRSAQLRAGRNVRIHDQEMELIFIPFLMRGADQHPAGFKSHHRAGREIQDRDQGLADQFFRLIESMDAAEDRPGGIGAVV